MQKAITRQTRSQTRATQGDGNSSSQPPCGGEQVHNNSEQPFEPSLNDIEHGDDYECVECKRPNNAELYMVQCGHCKHWYHFSCAKVDAATVRSNEFTCAKCSPKVPPPAASSTTGRISISSSRRAQIARDLQLLEDERHLRENVELERLQQEKMLVEKAMKEKLAREKEYLARKHELLRQQDEDAGSTLSSRSSHASSRNKVEAWFKYQLTADSIANGTNLEDPPVKPSVPDGSSTPMNISQVNDVVCTQALPGVNRDVTSASRTIDSVSIEESPGIDVEVHRQAGQQQQPATTQASLPKLPLVDIQPFVKFLDEAIPTSSEIALISKPLNTGALPKLVPKLIGSSRPYALWQRETNEVRRKHFSEQQHSEELQRRDQREQELLSLLKRAEEQREQDIQRVLEIEATLRKRMDVEKQQQKESDMRREREMDLVNRLKLLEHRCAQEQAMRVEEKQKFLSKEQRHCACRADNIQQHISVA
ncbi:uncharacterized protein LOC134215911 [Armigeres subalbatus]|uniref:uncharacterized protein LOC134215911 n=1 Tax=Armigeres subalbatus TaxID=124917 RepID=UPI002ED06CF3